MERPEEIEWRRKARKANITLILAVAAVIAWGFAVTREEPWTVLRAVGLVVFLVGVALVLTARLQLGDAFTPRAEARRLVTHGLYARLQHPIYLIGTFALAGFILFLNKPWGFLLLLLSIPVQVQRIRRERRVLRAAFGQEYEEYRKRTWF